MRHRALQVSLSAFAALLIGCSKSDFPTTPSPVADTPLTTLAALKVDGSASLPGGGQTPFNMTLIARSLDFTAPGTQAQTPGTTEVNGNFVLGTGVKGTVTGSIQGSLENGTLLGTLTSSADACTRQYTGPISTAGLAWLASDSTGGCPLPITVQASRAGAPSACTYSTSPVGAISSGGGTTVINIATGPTCTWVVQAQAPWVRITSPSTGVGPGTVTLVIDPSEVARQGTVLVAGQPLNIEQTLACTLSVAPQSVSFPDTGGSRTLTITTPASCEWRAENLPAWLTVSPGSGNGTTTATLVAQPNTGQERQASLRVAGQSVTTTQAGPSGGPPPCIEGVTLSASSFPFTGGTGSLDITAAAGCAWTAEADVPWIKISGGSGSGAGRITFTVDANTGAGRTGTIRVGGRVLTITQGLTPPCNYQVSASPDAFPASGGTGTVGVKVEDHCGWAVESTVDWIKVQTAAGRGSGSAAFIVAANPAGTAREGQVHAAGQSFRVTQQPLLAPVTVTLISEGVVDSCPGDDVCPTNYGGGSVTTNGFTCSIAETAGSSGPNPQQVCTGNFPVGFNVTFTAQPGPNSDFTGWSGSCGTGPNCTIMVLAAGQSLTATFTPEPVLRVVSDSGTIQLTSTPAGMTCTSLPRLLECRLQADINSDVVLTAVGENLYWSGCDTPSSETTLSNTCQLRLSRHRFVTATRTPICCGTLSIGIERFFGMQPARRR